MSPDKIIDYKGKDFSSIHMPIEALSHLRLPDHTCSRFHLSLGTHAMSLSQLLPLSLPRSRWNIKVIMPLGFCGGSDGKASARNVRDPGSIPVSGRSPGEGNGNPLQYSCLENSMVGGAWWATVHGVTKSQTWLSDFSLTHSLLCPWSFTWILWTPYLSPPFHFWTPSSIFPPNHPFTHAVPAFRLLKLALIQSQFFILGIPNDYFSVINFLDLQAVDHFFYLFIFFYFFR